MSIERRKGKIERKISSREPELGYYLIITDTEATEKNYFEGLKEKIPEVFNDKIVIKVIKLKRIKLENIVKDVKNLIGYDPQFRIPWIIIDKDENNDFDAIINVAAKNDINVGWSNPCIEIWFHAYFEDIPIQFNSQQCCSSFKEVFKRYTGKEYKKEDQKLYDLLCKYGNEERAIERAKVRLKHYKNRGVKESEMIAATNLHVLIDEIKSKIASK